MMSNREKKELYKEILRHSTVIETHVSKPYVIVRVLLNESKPKLIGLGLARCNDADVFNEQTGILIAHSRAIYDIMSVLYG